MRIFRPRAVKIILSLFTGLFFALLVLELGLRVHALFRPADSAVQATSAFTILCIGNSITKGEGVPAGQSYPELLEKLLQEKYPHLGAKVVNAGVSNATSTLLLQRLPRQLKLLKPRIVALMVGDPNYWFSYGRNLFLQKQDPGSRWSRIRWKADELLSSFRSVTFLRLILQGQAAPPPVRSPLQWLGTVESFNYSSELLRREPALRAYSSLSTFFKEHPDDVDVANALARLSLRLDNAQNFYQWLEVAQRLRPKRFFFDVHFSLERAWPILTPDQKKSLAGARALAMRNYPGDALYTALVSFHFKNHEIDLPERPKSVSKQQYCGYIGHLISFRPLDLKRYIAQAVCLEKEGKNEMAAEILLSAIDRNPFSFLSLRVRRKVIELVKGSAPAVQLKLEARMSEQLKQYGAQDGRKSNRDGETARWIRSDYKEIVALAQASGAKVIIQAYPPLRDHTMRAIDTYLPEIAVELGVPFSDTQSAIRSLNLDEKSWQTNYTDMFGPNDHHLSGRGNRMVANTLMESLEQQGWLK